MTSRNRLFAVATGVLSFAKTASRGDWTTRKALDHSGWQCPSYSLSSAQCVPRSRRTGIWYSRTWRSANNLPCSAIGRGDLD
jgi:hypothetical protein